MSPSEGQPGESGQERDYGLYGESAATNSGRKLFMTVMKMAPHRFTGIARKSENVFSKYNGFESVLISDPPVDVGSTEIKVLLRQAVPPAVYEIQLRAWVYFSQAFEISTRTWDVSGEARLLVVSGKAL